MEQRIVVVGAGHMGTVIARRLLEGPPRARVAVVEPADERRAALRDVPGLCVEASYRPEAGDMVVLALPPQAFGSFVDALPANAFAAATAVSIMAGTRLETLASGLGTGRVPRAMPHLASEVGQSMTLLCPGPDLPPGELERAERALSVIGRVLVVRDESLLDAGTAVAGSGPALVAYLTQAFTDYARQAGFDDADARVPACQVLRGTADVLEGTGTGPEALYRRASTPHGTTEQGIACLREHEVRAAVRTALERTAARARELAG
ncbi:pyrroline-5-carboxylate reductase dimerization domain-containing protein [Streptomyces sp. NPDC047017]|uniref:pyrroline-5-carboxylate reductase family protein n=1 Tax=Streptomyces sp. NPDC047017 TaxID=3155024 RepID=UPI003400A4DC